MSQPLSSWLRPLVLVLTLMLVVTACASGDSGTETASPGELSSVDDGDAATSDEFAPDATTAEPADEEAATAPSDDGQDAQEARDGRDVTVQAIQPPDIGRDIIFTADLTVAVTDVAAAGDEATSVIQGLGGFLFGQRTTASPEPSSVLTFKVFPEDFSEALSRLAEIGEVRTQNVSADDVTERIVDLESRINTAEASVERLRGFLAEASSIEVIADLENQLLERETQLETLRGQLRTLGDQVSLATIVVTFTEAAARPEIRVEATGYRGHDGSGLSCPDRPELRVDEGDDVTLCYEITNVGDTALADLMVRDPVLDIELGDMLVVFGDLEESLEPGQSVLLAYELVAERDIRTQTTVVATPVDEEGTPLPGREAASTGSFFVDAVDPGGIPGFGEALGESWELLVTLGQILLLVAGSLVPFVWIPILVWALLRVRKKRKEPTVMVGSEDEALVDEEPQPEPVGAVETGSGEK